MKLEGALVPMLARATNPTPARVPHLERNKVDGHEFFYHFANNYTEKSVDFISEMLMNATYGGAKWDNDVEEAQQNIRWKKSPAQSLTSPSEQALEGTTRKYNQLVGHDFYLPDLRTLRRHRLMNGELRLYNFTFDSYRVVYTTNEILDKMEHPDYMELLMKNDDGWTLKNQLHVVENILCVEAAGLEFARDDRGLDADELVVPIEPPRTEPAAFVDEDGDAYHDAEGIQVNRDEGPLREEGYTEWEVKAIIRERELDLEERKVAFAEQQEANKNYLGAFELTLKNGKAERQEQLDKFAVRFGFEDVAVDP